MLKDFAGYITYKIINLEYGSLIGDATEFFIYYLIKIFLLLTIIIFIISIIRSYFTSVKAKQILLYKLIFIGG